MANGFTYAIKIGPYSFDSIISGGPIEVEITGLGTRKTSVDEGQTLGHAAKYALVSFGKSLEGTADDLFEFIWFEPEARPLRYLTISLKAR